MDVPVNGLSRNDVLRMVYPIYLVRSRCSVGYPDMHLAWFHFLLVSPATVIAHGFVSKVTTEAGVEFPGKIPGSEETSRSPVFQISTSSPVKDPNGGEIICGPSPVIAEDIITVTPGETLSIEWADGDGNPNKWPHNVGPILNYLAPCSSADCSDVLIPREANFFKISQQGRTEDQNDDPLTWEQAKLMEGLPALVTLPEFTPSGIFVLRHEIIGLFLGQHIAQSIGGAEFYPSCIKLNVTGVNPGTFSGGEVKFPGAYKPDEPGITVNAFDPNIEYVFPGGDLVQENNIVTSSTAAAVPIRTTLSNDERTGTIATFASTTPQKSAANKTNEVGYLILTCIFIAYSLVSHIL
ncbi:hypothetical protein FRC03_012400 [Tulasnella sp. 419]|nr:hypothetical protein FRC03_012400 [Tulasnella sp. 419]